VEGIYVRTVSFKKSGLTEGRKKPKGGNKGRFCDACHVFWWLGRGKVAHVLKSFWLMETGGAGRTEENNKKINAVAVGEGGVLCRKKGSEHLGVCRVPFVHSEKQKITRQKKKREKTSAPT